MTSRLPLHLHPRPRQALLERLTASPAYQDLTRHGWAPLIVAAMLVLALLVAVLTRGLILTWDGWIVVPEEATYTPPPVVNTHCGDYCGTDAGLL